MRFCIHYALREMRVRPGWFAGLFLTEGILLYLYGLFTMHILRGNNLFEIILHMVLIAPLFLALMAAALWMLLR